MGERDSMAFNRPSLDTIIDMAIEKSKSQNAYFNQPDQRVLQERIQQMVEEAVQKQNILNHVQFGSQNSERVNYAGMRQNGGFQTLQSEEEFEGREKMHQMHRAVEDMQVSLSEREAEIIRLNLCLGDERKRNSDLSKQQQYLDMPLQMASANTPKRAAVLSRSSSRGFNIHQQVVHH